MGFLFILVGISIGLAVCYIYYGNKNTLPTGTTSWEECRYCEECKTVYPYKGITQKLMLVCPLCGNKTVNSVFRYNDGHIETKDKDKKK